MQLHFPPLLSDSCGKHTKYTYQVYQKSDQTYQIILESWTSIGAVGQILLK